jgi:hypothetical protein
MEVSHKNDVLESPALMRLGQFVRQQQEAWKTAEEVLDLERFEEELHEHMMALERELIAEELAYYDVTAEEVEIEGVVYRRTLESSETYLSAAGPVQVIRHLYRPSGRGSKSICPFELRAGIVRGLFTPRAARQGVFVAAHVTPREAAGIFAEIGNMRPSRSTLDRLPKELSAHWETHREIWEEALREMETIPDEATVLAVSLDGVMAPMKDAGRVEKRSQADKQAKGPAGYREFGCGTVSYYSQERERLATIRYGRMPEYKKTTLCQQLEAEVQSILALRPDLKIIKLADGAKENWRFLSNLDLGLSAEVSAQVEQIEIVDFYHAADHLKDACDAIWYKDKVRSKAEFERLRTLLKEKVDGVEKVIRSLKYHVSRARKRRKERIEKQLTYFRNNRHRMQYAHYIEQSLPIGSGVVEAACKTLVTQRMKQSGMSWRQPGGQAILTLRSLIQSNRWKPAWSLLRDSFRKDVKVPIDRKKNNATLVLESTQPKMICSSSSASELEAYYSLPLAA